MSIIYQAGTGRHQYLINDKYVISVLSRRNRVDTGIPRHDFKSYDLTVNYIYPEEFFMVGQL